LHYEITFLFFHCRGPKALLRLLSAQKHLLQSPPEPICVYYFMLLFFWGKHLGWEVWQVTPKWQGAPFLGSGRSQSKVDAHARKGQRSISAGPGDTILRFSRHYIRFWFI